MTFLLTVTKGYTIINGNTNNISVSLNQSINFDSLETALFAGVETETADTIVGELAMA